MPVRSFKQLPALLTGCCLLPIVHCPLPIIQFCNSPKIRAWDLHNLTGNYAETVILVQVKDITGDLPDLGHFRGGLLHQPPQSKQ